MSGAGVPALFDRALLRRRIARAGRAGSGPDFLRRRVAEDLEDRLAATLHGFPLALDLATPGPEFAAALARRRGGERTLRAGLSPGVDLVADPEASPLRPGAFDLIVSGLALQLVNDLPGALAQIRAALRPDGLFLASVLGGDTLHELRAAFAQAEAETTGGSSPRVAPFADVRAFGGLLQRAGFALPVTDSDRVTVRYPHALALFADLRAWGAANPLEERARRPLARATLARLVEIYAERFADADGRVRATFEIVWLSGWAPHPDQPKPLKPGSATTRLADALEEARAANMTEN
ncbi:methyltransferase domain-containing protein [Methylopila musalis]|uniref:Methyltransferase domain-containing protein n=1 Tax=Methylopila musalis TaxID=1134781 RepID=A0ABW3ZB49_9HYPH